MKVVENRVHALVGRAGNHDRNEDRRRCARTRRWSHHGRYAEARYAATALRSKQPILFSQATADSSPTRRMTPPSIPKERGPTTNACSPILSCAKFPKKCILNARAHGAINTWVVS
ncbi:hypothetical protein C8Q79DRAFT_487250 [Trametes meyenii]|nr:hypothetical protein C8Q79DRAFT_487250 [Trametes meyenii]